jgi:hypothetical protein
MLTAEFCGERVPIRAEQVTPRSWLTTPHPLAFPISQFLELPPPGLRQADFDQPLIEEVSDNIRGDRSQTRSPRVRRKQGSPKFSIGYAGISHCRFGSCRSWQRPAPLALQPLASVRYGHPHHIASIFLRRRDCGASSRLCCLGTSQISIRGSQIVRNRGPAGGLSKGSHWDPIDLGQCRPASPARA